MTQTLDLMILGGDIYHWANHVIYSALGTNKYQQSKINIDRVIS